MLTGAVSLPVVEGSAVRGQQLPLPPRDAIAPSALLGTTVRALKPLW